MAKTALSRDEALRLLREHMPVLVERFGVSELALFGSTARDEATPSSDVDILVRFERKPETSWGCYPAQSYLADVFGRHVDMVEHHLMRKEYLPWVEAESVDPMNLRPRMSNGSPPKRWDVYIQDMQRRCDEVIAFSTGLDYEGYLADDKTIAATSFSLTQIGEAAGKVPEHIRDAHPEIDWDRMIGFRNLIVHAYYEIKQEKPWDIIKSHVPDLARRLVPLLAEARAEVRETGVFSVDGGDGNSDP